MKVDDIKIYSRSCQILSYDFPSLFCQVMSFVHATCRQRKEVVVPYAPQSPWHTYEDMKAPLYVPLPKERIKRPEPVKPKIQDAWVQVYITSSVGSSYDDEGDDDSVRSGFLRDGQVGQKM